MIKLIKDLLNFRQMGLLEFLFVLYPIVSGYILSPLPVYLWWLLIIDFVAYRSYIVSGKHVSPKYRNLFWFVTVHNVVWIAVIFDVTSAYINSIVSILITMASVFLIAPVLNFNKVKNSIKLLTVITILGMLFCVAMIFKGNFIGQLPLPPFSGSRIENNTVDLFTVRPKGFFPEPQAFCTYMQIPLFLCLLYKKYLWAFLIMITMLLSTSTTGLVVSFLMVGIYFFTQKVAFRLKLLVLIVASSAFLLLTRTNHFEATMNKAIETKLTENERTSVGFITLPQLEPQELFFGIAYTNLGQMYDAGRLHGNYMLMGDNGKHHIFVPTIWIMLFHYGIIGLILYLMVYYEVYRKSKLILPLLGAIIATCFSNSESIGPTFFYQISFIYCFIKAEKNNKLELKD